jgi:hypothetical protein
MRPINSTLLAIAFLAPAAAASTWVVAPTAGVGVDFTDIASAITASAPGDVILVRPGSYGGFTVDVGVSILGDSGAVVTGRVRVSGVPAGPRATLANMSVRTVEVLQCSAAVTLEDIVSRPLSADLNGASLTSMITITGSTDVRLRDVDADMGFNQGTFSALSASASRVEVTHSRLRGSWGHSHDIYLFAGAPEDGGDGIKASNGAGLHVSSTDILGGPGGNLPSMNLCSCFTAGDGGTGIRLASGSHALVTGPGSTLILGGPGGGADYCNHVGLPGIGIATEFGASLRVSHVTIAGGPPTGSCTPPGATISGPYTLATPSDPTLSVSGTIQQGHTVTFSVTGQPGQAARLFLGRQLTVQPLAGSSEDQLLVPLRGYDLGTLPAGGLATYTMVLPASLPKGTLLVAQARTTTSGGAVSLTQSVPITLR